MCHNGQWSSAASAATNLATCRLLPSAAESHRQRRLKNVDSCSQHWKVETNREDDTVLWRGQLPVELRYIHCIHNIVMSTVARMHYCRGSHALLRDYMVCRNTISKINGRPDFLCFSLWRATTWQMHTSPRLPLLLLLQQRLFALPRG